MSDLRKTTVAFTLVFKSHTAILRKFSIERCDNVAEWLCYCLPALPKRKKSPSPISGYVSNPQGVGIFIFRRRTVGLFVYLSLWNSFLFWATFWELQSVLKFYLLIIHMAFWPMVTCAALGPTFSCAALVGWLYKMYWLGKSKTATRALCIDGFCSMLS